jgi:hypothetical protein
MINPIACIWNDAHGLQAWPACIRRNGIDFIADKVLAGWHAGSEAIRMRWKMIRAAAPPCTRAEG